MTSVMAMQCNARLLHNTTVKYCTLYRYVCTCSILSGEGSMPGTMWDGAKASCST